MKNRFARPENFASRHRTPLLREHFVYRAISASGELLYVGCSLDVAARMKAHKSNGDWYHLMARLRTSGPHNFETARLLEREAIRTERPLFNSMTPERCAVNAANARILNRRQGLLMKQGLDFWAAFHEAREHADSVLAAPKNRSGFRATDLTIPNALRADRDDAAAYERQSA